MKTLNKDAIQNALYETQSHLRHAEDELHSVLPHGQPTELSEEDLADIRHFVYRLFSEEMNLITERLASICAHIEATKEPEK